MTIQRLGLLIACLGLVIALASAGMVYVTSRRDRAYREGMARLDGPMLRPNGTPTEDPTIPPDAEYPTDLPSQRLASHALMFWWEGLSDAQRATVARRAHGQEAGR